jgi:hypothetical protein
MVQPHSTTSLSKVEHISNKNSRPSQILDPRSQQRPGETRLHKELRSDYSGLDPRYLHIIRQGKCVLRYGCEVTDGSLHNSSLGGCAGKLAIFSTGFILVPILFLEAMAVLETE